MKKHEKEGETWWSHKLSDGTWCNGKQKKEHPKPAAHSDKQLRAEVWKMAMMQSDSIEETIKNADIAMGWINK